MPLNIIKNAALGHLAAEVAPMATTRRERMLRFPNIPVWPDLPAGVRGGPIAKRERERILGYGPEWFEGTA